MRHPRETIIHVRATRAEVVRILNQLPAVAAGRGGSPSAGQWANVLLVRVGLSVLGRIKEAFIDKARGGADQSGLRWKPLSKKTVAYSRRHPGVLFPGKLRAPYSPSWMLKDRERKRWWELYHRFGGGKPSGAAYHKHHSNDWAAARAWKILKAEGAQTLLGVYGDAPVEILRDSGLLLNSLSPGVDPDDAGPTPPKVKDQVFRLNSGEVIIGTSRKWAGSHHKGVSGRIPQRRLWPEPNKWPRPWWADAADQARQGVIDVALYLLGKGRL